MSRDLHHRAWWNLPILNLRAWTWRDARKIVHKGEWYQNAVIYQLSSWGFQDSDGDGKGDLAGIVRRLDYIASLGVDAIWLTPIYPSPGTDFGYDVSGLRGINEAFGSMDEFHRLLRLVHQRRIKLIMDMVWNHTSDQHHWFLESRSSRDNPKADWYVWRDPAPDGGPPNNWRSVLTGGSAWRYEESRGQYYLFNFYHMQPNLNWYHREVRDQILDVARFWLDQGIDGMRLDAVNFYCHDPQFRDDPPRAAEDGKPDGIAPDLPAVELKFVHSINQPESFEVVRELRALSNDYPGTILLGEVTLSEDSIATAADYVRGDDRLHLAYHSGLISDEPITAPQLRRLIEKTAQHFVRGGACAMAGNHDYGRMRSLWSGAETESPDSFFRMMTAVLLSMPGALCLWQGDELGLPEARIPEDIPPERLRDPVGRREYPQHRGRDGSRTPMPWDDRLPQFDFTDADQAWLPIPDSHRSRSVRRQNADPDSLLNTWRELLYWRVGQPALHAGTMQVADVPEPLFEMVREYDEQRLLCLFNVSADTVDADLSGFDEPIPARGLSFDFEWSPQTRGLRLPPWGIFFADLWHPNSGEPPDGSGTGPRGRREPEQTESALTGIRYSPRSP